MLLSMYIDLHILFGALNGLNITNVVQSSKLNNLMTHFYPIQLVFFVMFIYSDSCSICLPNIFFF